MLRAGVQRRLIRLLNFIDGRAADVRCGTPPGASPRASRDRRPGYIAVGEQQAKGGIGGKTDVRIDKEQMGKLRAGEEQGHAVVAGAGDEAIAAADTLLLTVPNQLGVEYNAHAVESILKYVAPELGWR